MIQFIRNTKTTDKPQLEGEKPIVTRFNHPKDLTNLTAPQREQIVRTVLDGGDGIQADIEPRETETVRLDYAYSEDQGQTPLLNAVEINFGDDHAG